MPVAWSQTASGTILVEESATTGNRVALYARVSSNDQRLTWNDNSAAFTVRDDERHECGPHGS
jgi:hypothetical protein